MACMTQEKKKVIAENLKKVMPKDWKYSLAVENHTTLVLNIKSAPVDILKAVKPTEYRDPSLLTHLQIAWKRFDDTFTDSELVSTFQAMNDALNTINHDRSDVMTDYFDVGYYTRINVGRFDRPFQVG
jgi:hypothetical protein